MNLDYNIKNRCITYNNVGLVDSIIFSNNAKIEYTYGLNGEKLKIVQQTHYYPFGGIIADLSKNTITQDRLYNGKELDRTNSIFWSDYGARQYDATRGQWTTPDPLAEKYYGWDMFGYCKNNPIKFIDPDGKKIEFAQGSSDVFKEQFWQAIEYLTACGCDHIYRELEAREDKIYYIKEVDSQGSFDDISTIEWAPMKGMYTESDCGYNFLSPATLLNHEFGHAYDQLTNPNYNSSEKDDQYDLTVERKVITGIETETARSLGELQSGDVTRIAYNGIKSDVPSPTSNKLTITPQIKEKMELWK